MFDFHNANGFQIPEAARYTCARQNAPEEEEAAQLFQDEYERRRAETSEYGETGCTEALLTSAKASRTKYLRLKVRPAAHEVSRTSFSALSTAWASAPVPTMKSFTCDKVTRFGSNIVTILPGGVCLS